MSIQYSLHRVLVVVCAALFTCTAIHAKECGYKSKMLDILKGSRAYENEFPWQVSWRFYNQTTHNHRHICGGSILSDYWVLTAAHCVDVFNNAKNINEKNFRAMVGAQRQSKRSRHQQVIKVKKIYVHPKWNPENTFNDLALVELSRPIGLSFGPLNAICLGKPEHQTEGKTAVISGWGWSRNSSGKISDHLKRGLVPVTSLNRCQPIYSQWMVKPMIGGQVCVGPNSSVCKGDSGGPLQYEVDGRWYLLGAASWGVRCGKGDHPSIFTRVPFYLEFIEQITGLTPP